MKTAIYWFAALIAFCGIVTFSCASAPPETENAAIRVYSAPEAPSGGNGLNAQAFKTLPAEARAYLERLARAFGSQDEAFLLAQGEEQFEAEMRPRYDKEAYLALLYRIGVYAEDSPRAGVMLPLLNPSKVKRIDYLSWEDSGPLLEIKARLIGADGKTTPCLIMLVWRLREPKIEGLFL
jgi:hypothetical protein